MLLMTCIVGMKEHDVEMKRAADQGDLLLYAAKLARIYWMAIDETSVEYDANFGKILTLGTLAAYALSLIYIES